MEIQLKILGGDLGYRDIAVYLKGELRVAGKKDRGNHQEIKNKKKDLTSLAKPWKFGAKSGKATSEKRGRGAQGCKRPTPLSQKVGITLKRRRSKECGRLGKEIRW